MRGSEWYAELLAAITAAQSMLVGVIRPKPLFEGLLAAVLRLTGSEYGFVGEVRRTDSGGVSLFPHAVLNLGWDGEARPGAGTELLGLETLVAQVMESGRALVANPPRAARTPPDGPPLPRAFLGVPLESGGSLVGVIALADRPAGYDEELLASLEPLIATCANALFAVRADQQRRRAEEQLRSEEARFRAMLAGVHDGIITMDNEGVIESVNPAAEKMFGYSANELLGQPVFLLIPERLRGRPDEPLRSFLRTGEPDFIGTTREFPASRKDGSEFPADLRTTEVWGPEKKLFTGIFHDLSEREEARRQVDRLQAELTRSRFGQMIGSSAPMRELYQRIHEVAAGDWNVLIEGETGVGKELVARALHAASARRDRPFLASNLPGVTDSLLGSHLFGHRKGSFTGAHRDQQGLFEAADGGTLFLDEVADISESLQAALLRVIEEGEIVRIGESAPRKIDVRILAATNRGLLEEVRAGRFREDLFYRLRVGRITVPPLRQRLADIPLLAEAFLAQARVASGKTITELVPAAMKRLVNYSWPGNVRELRNCIDYAVIHCRVASIEVEHLPPEILTGNPIPVAVAASPDAQRQYILDVLERTGGNRTAAAKELGMSRATLYRRLETLGIEA